MFIKYWNIFTKNELILMSINQILYYLMYVGLGLAFVILLPYPRIIRRPIVHLFEVVLTNKYLTYLEFALLLLCGVVCGMSF